MKNAVWNRTTVSRNHRSRISELLKKLGGLFGKVVVLKSFLKKGK
jgi:hypothetical protein